MVALLIAIGVLVLALLAEGLHARRIRRIAHLAFGPSGKPHSWTRWTILARPAGMALLTWGLLVLYEADPKIRIQQDVPDAALKRIIIALDVSPSMHLVDAGEKRDQSRAKRAAQVLLSVMDRISLEQARVTVIAFYNGAKPVVVDTRDPAVVRNIVNDLPLDYAFDAGKTDMLAGVKEAFALAKPWREKSATLLLVSDGDTVSSTGMPTPPPAIAEVMVLGLGDATTGKFIDDHNSRQDVSTLRQVAARLGGSYHNANDRNVPSDMISELSGLLPIKSDQKAGLRELAIAAVGIGGSLVAAVPVLLGLWGTAWRPGYRGARDVRETSVTMEGAAHA